MRKTLLLSGASLIALNGCAGPLTSQSFSWFHKSENSPATQTSPVLQVVGSRARTRCCPSRTRTASRWQRFNSRGATGSASSATVTDVWLRSRENKPFL